MKRIILILTIFVFVFTLLVSCVGEPVNSQDDSSNTSPDGYINTDPNPPDTTPDNTGNEGSNTLLAAYNAYYELIESLIEEYGVGYNLGGLEWDNEEPGWWWTVSYRGVVYAELIDFDNDGLPELLVVYSDGETWFHDTWAIYGFTDSIEHYFEGYIRGEGGGGTDAEFALCNNGKIYLVLSYGYFVYDAEWEQYYYTVRDGIWETVLTRSVSIIDYDTDDFEWQWMVNGHFVSENEYETAPETELGIIDIRSIPFYTRYEEDLDTKNQRATDFINALLAELADRIAQLESLIENSANVD